MLTTDAALAAEVAAMAADTRPVIQPDTHASDAIAHVIKELRVIEPQVGGNRLSHRFAVKHAADELGEVQKHVIDIQNAHARARQTEIDLLDDIADRRAEIRRLNNVIRALGGESQ